MPESLSILFGAGFTVAVSIAIGSLLLQRLRVALHRMEWTLIAFVAGAGCLSFATTILCLIHQARKGVFLWGGWGVILWAVWSARVKTARGKTAARRTLPAVPLVWIWSFYLVFSIFFIYYFFNAMAPEVSPDGSGYHLGNVLRTWRNHGFVWDYHSLYSYLSQGTEMLFLVAFSFGRHSAAALVHLAFLCTLPLLMVCYGRRFGYPRAALFAAILVYAAPVVAKDGVSAYTDVAVATLTYTVFYLLEVWDETNKINILIIIGLISGCCYAVKYTAFLVFPFAATWVLWRPGVPGISRLQRFVVLAIPAAIMAAPWVLRNWIWLGNPFAPFLNSWFPNLYYHPGMERIYLDGLRHYPDLKHWWEIPLQLTLRGSVVGGVFGPVFLLAPFALLALRHSRGRLLLLAALVFAVPAYFNIGARFLIPSAPFLALAMGMGLADYPGILPALAAFHVLVSWPPVLSTYCDQWNWRIGGFPIEVALRQQPAAPYIQKSLGDYALKSTIERTVPRNQKIFSFAGRPEAYIERDIVVSYESAFGNLPQDILLTPQSHRPDFQQTYRFLPVSTRAVRVVNIASAPGFWTVAEMRILSGGRELPRSPGWRLSAWPNPAEAPLAFDNSYATRWSTWEAMSPHARIQVDFGESQRIDEVRLECAPAWEARVQVEVLTEGGRWVALTDTPEFKPAVLPGGIRRAATRDLKELGFQYLLINDGDFVFEDMKKYPSSWGITQLAEANGTHFFHID